MRNLVQDGNRQRYSNPEEPISKGVYIRCYKGLVFQYAFVGSA